MLDSDNIMLRALEPEDLELLYQWENNTQLWDAGNTRTPYSRFVLKQYILNSDKDIYENKQLRLMICLKTGERIGTVDLYDFDMHNSRVALGLFIDSGYQGKGYARETLRLIEEYVFDYLNVNQLYCHIAINNHASRTMFEKANYEKSSILKDWIKTTKGFRDVIVFQQFNAIYQKKKIVQK